MILWCFRGTLADHNTRSARSVSETFFSPPDPQPVQLHATTTCQGESLDISSVKIAYFGGWNYRLYKSPKGDVHREIEETRIKKKYKCIKKKYPARIKKIYMHQKKYPGATV